MADRIAPEVEQEILRRWDDGEGPAKILAHVDTSRTTLYKVLERNQRQLRQTRKDSAEIEVAARLALHVMLDDLTDGRVWIRDALKAIRRHLAGEDVTTEFKELLESAP